MANDTLQAESAQTTPAFDPKLLATAARFMGLRPDDPRVAERLADEDKERAALDYAAGGVSAALDALAVLDALDMVEMYGAGTEDRRKRETVDRLLRLTRRNLRAAVGSCDHPGYGIFLDMLAAHGLDIYGD